MQPITGADGTVISAAGSAVLRDIPSKIISVASGLATGALNTGTVTFYDSNIVGTAGNYGTLAPTLIAVGTPSITPYDVQLNRTAKRGIFYNAVGTPNLVVTYT